MGTWVGPLYLVLPQTTSQVNCCYFRLKSAYMVKTAQNDKSLFERPQNRRQSIPEDQKIHKSWAEVKISVHLNGYHKCDRNLRQSTATYDSNVQEYRHMRLWYRSFPEPLEIPKEFRRPARIPKIIPNWDLTYPYRTEIEEHRTWYFRTWCPRRCSALVFVF